MQENQNFSFPTEDLTYRTSPYPSGIGSEYFHNLNLIFIIMLRCLGTQFSPPGLRIKPFKTCHLIVTAVLFVNILFLKSRKILSVHRADGVDNKVVTVFTSYPNSDEYVQYMYTYQYPSGHHDLFQEENNFCP